MYYLKTFCVCLLHILILPGLNASEKIPDYLKKPLNNKAPAPLKLPWKNGVSYTYTWHLLNQETGKTTFNLSWKDKTDLIACKATLTLKKAGSEIEGLFLSTYNKKMQPISFTNGFLGKLSRHASGHSGLVTHFTKDAIKIKVGSLEGDTKTIPKPDKPFFLSGGHAIHHWALFMPAVDKTKKSAISLFMPSISEFVEVTFTPEGKENTRGKEAVRMAFNALHAKNRQRLFYGTVWVGPEGRLLRYRQPNQDGALEVWLHPDCLKK